MHHSRLGGLIIDCQTRDLQRDGAFWSEALGYAIRATDNPDDVGYLVFDTPPGEPYVEVQAVDHPSRVHLDIKTDNLDAEVRRLEDLGATRVRRVKEWWVMQAPSGHRFCVIPLHPGQDVGRMNVWDSDSRKA